MERPQIKNKGTANEMNKKTKTLSVAVSEAKLKEIDDIRLRLPFKPSRSAFAEPFIDEGIAKVRQSLNVNQAIDSNVSIGGGQVNG
jgi:hypothetical protein